MKLSAFAFGLVCATTCGRTAAPIETDIQPGFWQPVQGQVSWTEADQICRGIYAQLCEVKDICLNHRIKQLRNTSWPGDMYENTDHNMWIPVKHENEDIKDMWVKTNTFKEVHYIGPRYNDPGRWKQCGTNRLANWTNDYNFATAVFTTAICCRAETHEQRIKRAQQEGKPVIEDQKFKVNGNLHKIVYTTTPSPGPAGTKESKKSSTVNVSRWYNLKNSSESGKYQPTWQQARAFCKKKGEGTGELCAIQDICSSYTDGFDKTGGALNNLTLEASKDVKDSEAYKAQTGVVPPSMDRWTPYKEDENTNQWVMTSTVRTHSGTRLGGPCWKVSKPSWGDNPRSYPHKATKLEGHLKMTNLTMKGAAKYDWKYQITESVCCTVRESKETASKTPVPKPPGR